MFSLILTLPAFAYDCTTDTNVFGCWLAEDASGGLADSSPNSRNLTEVGSGHTYQATGQFGYGVTLNGSSQAFQGDSYESTLDNLTEGTVAMWVKTNAIATFQGGICISNPASNDDIVCLSVGSTGTYAYLHYQVKNGTTTTLLVEAKNAADTWTTSGEWHHIAVTVETGVGNVVYVDGVPATSPTYTTGSSSTAAFFSAASPTGNNSFDVGLRDISAADNFFSGTIDEILITGSVLNSTEIADLYANGISATPGSGGSTTRRTLILN